MITCDKCQCNISDIDKTISDNDMEVAYEVLTIKDEEYHLCCNCLDDILEFIKTKK